VQAPEAERPADEIAQGLEGGVQSP
jgi:hypothetical protein